ncbi:hypothetical protein [Chryseolinea lacunae]|uniref:BcpO-related WXXGXW repeat protein n=1 Tax=Chryseolinea lacunae TaxID=2801331 RepID=A0ABS1KL01_9BACT|nr:hypothetical protein [Chryseolinea lacunae]MBL0740018.1 hypothetical protein [Chryseolinea lacunae]
MKTTAIALIIAIGSVVGLSSCAHHDKLSRAERTQTLNVARTPQYVYRNGHMGWSKGYNPVPPVKRNTWVPGKWYNSSQGKVWVAGYWR